MTAGKDTESSMDQKKGMSRIRGIIILVLLAVMLVSGAMSIHSWVEDKRTGEEYERLAELASETTAQPYTEAVAEPGPAEPETEPYVSPINFEELMKENPDTIGWIRVPDTNIDYPIVQGEDNDFYLNHDFYGKENIAGAIYLDFESQGDFAGRNNVLYGHNMKNGSMFKDVNRFKDEAYFKEHRFFSIYTPDREIKLQAVAAYYGEAQPIVRKTRFKSQESFDAFVHEMVKPCSYGEEITYPAKTLYTLVTCSYEIKDARTFLFAVEVDEDGNQIQPDDAFLQRMDELMGDKNHETVQETAQGAVRGPEDGTEENKQ